MIIWFWVTGISSSHLSHRIPAVYKKANSNLTGSYWHRLTQVLKWNSAIYFGLSSRHTDGSCGYRFFVHDTYPFLSEKHPKGLNFQTSCTIPCPKQYILLVYRRVAKLQKATNSFVVSVHLYTWNSSSSTGQIFIKSDIGEFFENCPENSGFTIIIQE